MTPIFQNAAIDCEDLGKYIQNFHTENGYQISRRQLLIGSYLIAYAPPEVVSSTFRCAIKYTQKQSF